MRAKLPAWKKLVMKVVLASFLIQIFSHPFLLSSESYTYRISQTGGAQRRIDFTPLSNVQGLQLPDVQLLINPSGISYGGSIKMNQGTEFFSIPHVQKLNSQDLLKAGDAYPGSGVILIPSKNPLWYADSYKVQTFLDESNRKNIFTTGMGVNNGGLFLGVGSSLENAYLNSHSMGSIKTGVVLPTGSGLLLSQKKDTYQAWNVNALALNSAWNPLLPGKGRIEDALMNSGNPEISKVVPGNFLASSRFETKINPIQNYFPEKTLRVIHEKFGKTANFSEDGMVSPRTFSKFYERTDPARSGGPGIFTYSIPEKKTFEYATSGGFQYSRFPVNEIGIQWSLENPQFSVISIAKDNGISKRFLPSGNGSWILADSIQQIRSDAGAIPARRFTSQNGGTAEIYRMAGNLEFKSAIEGTWQKYSKLERKDSHVMDAYQAAVFSGRQALELIRPGIDDVKLQIQSARNTNTILPIFDLRSIKQAPLESKPLFKESIRDFKRSDSGMKTARETEFLKEPDVTLFQKRENSLQGSYSAVKSLPHRLQVENTLVAALAYPTAKFELIEEDIPRQKKISSDIQDNFDALSQAGNLFGAHGFSGAELLYKESAQMFQSAYLQKSNMDRAKAKAFFDLANESLNPAVYLFARSASLKSAFQSISLQGIEQGNLWKRGLGEAGELAITVLPFTSLGERMISAYGSKEPPGIKGLLSVWAFQTFEDSLKTVLLGGFSAGLRGQNSGIFSKESIELSIRNIRSQIPVTMGLGLTAGVQGIADSICPDCKITKDLIGWGGFVGGVSALRLGGTYFSAKMEGNLLLSHIKDFGPEILKDEGISYGAMLGLNSGIGKIQELPFFRNHAFLTQQLQMSLDPAIPLVVGSLDKGLEIANHVWLGSENAGIQRGPIQGKAGPAPPVIRDRDTIVKERLLTLNDQSTDSPPLTPRQMEAVSYFNSNGIERHWDTQGINDFKEHVMNYLEDAAWRDHSLKNHVAPGETADTFFLKDFQKKQISEFSDSLISGPKTQLPITINVIGTGSGKTYLEMAQLMVLRQLDRKGGFRTAVNSDTDANVRMLYETAKRIYGESLGRMGIIEENTSPEKAGKIARNSEVLFMTIAKQGELYAMDRQLTRTNGSGGKLILNLERMNGSKIVDEIDKAIYLPRHVISSSMGTINRDSREGKFWSILGETAKMLSEKYPGVVQGREGSERGAVLRLLVRSKDSGLSYSETEIMRILENGIQAIKDHKGEDYSVVRGKIKIIQAGTAKDLVREAGYMQALENAWGLKEFTRPHPVGESPFYNSDLDALKSGRGKVVGNTGTLTSSARKEFARAFSLNENQSSSFVMGETQALPENSTIFYEKNLKELLKQSVKLVKNETFQVITGSRSPEEARILRNLILKSKVESVKNLFLAGSNTPGNLILEAAGSGRKRVILGNAEQIGRGVDLTPFPGTEKLRVIGLNTVASPEADLIQLFGRGLGERVKKWAKGSEFFLLADGNTLDRVVPHNLIREARKLGGWSRDALKALLPEIQGFMERKAVSGSFGEEAELKGGKKNDLQSGGTGLDGERTGRADSGAEDKIPVRMETANHTDHPGDVGEIAHGERTDDVLPLQRGGGGQTASVNEVGSGTGIRQTISGQELRRWIRERKQAGEVQELDAHSRDIVLRAIPRLDQESAQWIKEHLKIYTIGPVSEYHLVRGELAASDPKAHKLYIPRGLFVILDASEMAGLILHYAFGRPYPDYTMKILESGIRRHMELLKMEEQLSNQVSQARMQVGPERLKEVDSQDERGKARFYYPEVERYLKSKRHLLSISRNASRLHEHLAPLVGGKENLNLIEQRLRNGEKFKNAVDSVLVQERSRGPPAKNPASPADHAMDRGPAPLPTENLMLYRERGRTSQGMLSQRFHKAKKIISAIMDVYDSYPLDSNIVTGSYHKGETTAIFLNRVPSFLSLHLREVFEHFINNMPSDLHQALRDMKEKYLLGRGQDKLSSSPLGARGSEGKGTGKTTKKHALADAVREILPVELMNVPEIDGMEIPLLRILIPLLQEEFAEDGDALKLGNDISGNIRAEIREEPRRRESQDTRKILLKLAENIQAKLDSLKDPSHKATAFKEAVLNYKGTLEKIYSQELLKKEREKDPVKSVLELIKLDSEGPVEPEIIRTARRELYTEWLEAAEFKPGKLNPETRPSLFQLVGIKRLMRMKRALLADAMGTGKTLQVLTAAMNLKDVHETLIVCPVAAMDAWVQDNLMHLRGKRKIILLSTEYSHIPSIGDTSIEHYNGRQSLAFVKLWNQEVRRGVSQKRHEKRFVVMNYDQLRLLQEKSPGILEKVRPDFLVVDEAHSIKNIKERVLRTKFVRKINAHRLALITGTPIENVSEDAQIYLRMIFKDKVTENEQFKGSSFKDFSTFWKEYEKNPQYPALQAELNRIMNGVMIRREAEDVMAGLPVKTEVFRLLNLMDGTMEEWRAGQMRKRVRLNGNFAVQAHLIQWLLGHSWGKQSRKLSAKVLDLMSIWGNEFEYWNNYFSSLSGSNNKFRSFLPVDNGISLMMRVNQAFIDPWIAGVNAESIKFSALEEILKEKLNSGGKIIVYSGFVSVARKIRGFLGKEFSYMDGSTSPERRLEEIRRFQTGSSPMFVATLQTAGESINLNRAGTVIFFDRPWKPSTIHQAAGRPYRWGNANSRLVIETLSVRWGKEDPSAPTDFIGNLGAPVPGTDAYLERLLFEKDLEEKRMMQNGFPVERRINRPVTPEADRGKNPARSISPMDKAHNQESRSKTMIKSAASMLKQSLKKMKIVSVGKKLLWTQAKMGIISIRKSLAGGDFPVSLEKRIFAGHGSLSLFLTHKGHVLGYRVKVGGQIEEFFHSSIAPLILESLRSILREAFTEYIRLIPEENGTGSDVDMPRPPTEGGDHTERYGEIVKRAGRTYGMSGNITKALRGEMSEEDLALKIRGALERRMTGHWIYPYLSGFSARWFLRYSSSLSEILARKFLWSKKLGRSGRNLFLMAVIGGTFLSEDSENLELIIGLRDEPGIRECAGDENLVSELKKSLPENLRKRLKIKVTIVGQRWLSDDSSPDPKRKELLLKMIAEGAVLFGPELNRKEVLDKVPRSDLWKLSRELIDISGKTASKTESKSSLSLAKLLGKLAAQSNPHAVYERKPGLPGPQGEPGGFYFSLPRSFPELQDGLALQDSSLRSDQQELLDRIHMWVRLTNEKIEITADSSKMILRTGAQFAYTFLVHIFDRPSLIVAPEKFALCLIMPNGSSGKVYDLSFQSALFQIQPAVLRNVILPVILKQMKLISEGESPEHAREVSMADLTKKEKVIIHELVREIILGKSQMEKELSQENGSFVPLSPSPFLSIKRSGLGSVFSNLKNRAPQIEALSATVLTGSAMLWFATSFLHTPQVTWTLIDPLISVLGRFMGVFFGLGTVPYKLFVPIFSFLVPSALFNLAIIAVQKNAVDRALNHPEAGRILSPVLSDIPADESAPGPVSFWKLASVDHGWKVYRKGLQKLPQYLQIFVVAHVKAGYGIKNLKEFGSYYFRFLSGFSWKILSGIFFPMEFTLSVYNQVRWLSKELPSVGAEELERIRKILPFSKYDYELESARIIHIADGDTYTALLTTGEQRKIRIIGFNALETSETEREKRDYERYPHMEKEKIVLAAEEAKKRAEELLLGKEAIVLFKKKGWNDYERSYERYVAHIYISDESLWILTSKKLKGLMGGEETNGDRPEVIRSGNVKWDNRYESLQRKYPAVPDTFYHPSAAKMTGSPVAWGDRGRVSISKNPRRPVIDSESLLDKTVKVLQAQKQWHGRPLQKIAEDLKGWKELQIDLKSFGLDPGEVFLEWSSWQNLDFPSWFLRNPQAGGIRPGDASKQWLMLRAKKEGWSVQLMSRLEGFSSLVKMVLERVRGPYSLVIAPECIAMDAPQKISLLLVRAISEGSRPKTFVLKKEGDVNSNAVPVELTEVGREWLFRGGDERMRFQILSEFIYGITLHGKRLSDPRLVKISGTSGFPEKFAFESSLEREREATLPESGDPMPYRIQKLAMANRILSEYLPSLSGDSSIILASRLEDGARILRANLGRYKSFHARAALRELFSKALESRPASESLQSNNRREGIYNGSIITGKECIEALAHVLPWSSLSTEEKSQAILKLGRMTPGFMGKDLGAPFEFLKTPAGQRLKVRMHLCANNLPDEAEISRASDLFLWGSIIRAGPTLDQQQEEYGYELLLNPLLFSLDQASFNMVLSYYFKQIISLSQGNPFFGVLHNTQQEFYRRREGKVLRDSLKYLLKNVRVHSLEPLWKSVEPGDGIKVQGGKDHERIAQGLSAFLKSSPGTEGFPVLIAYEDGQLENAEKVLRVFLANQVLAKLCNKNIPLQAMCDAKVLSSLRIYIGPGKVTISSPEGIPLDQSSANRLSLLISSVIEYKYDQGKISQDSLVPDDVLCDAGTFHPAENQPSSVKQHLDSFSWPRSYALIYFIISSFFLGAAISAGTLPFWGTAQSLRLENLRGLNHFIKIISSFILRSHPTAIAFFLTYTPLMAVTLLRDSLLRFPIIFLAKNKVSPFRKEKPLRGELSVYRDLRRTPTIQNQYGLVSVNQDGSILIRSDVFNHLPDFLQFFIFQGELVRARTFKRMELVLTVIPFVRIRRFFFELTLLFIEPFNLVFEWVRSMDLNLWRNPHPESRSILKNMPPGLLRKYKLYFATVHGFPSRDSIQLGDGEKVRVFLPKPQPGRNKQSSLFLEEKGGVKVGEKVLLLFPKAAEPYGREARIAHLYRILEGLDEDQYINVACEIFRSFAHKELPYEEFLKVPPVLPMLTSDFSRALPLKILETIRKWFWFAYLLWVPLTSAWSAYVMPYAPFLSQVCSGPVFTDPGHKALLFFTGTMLSVYFLGRATSLFVACALLGTEAARTDMVRAGVLDAKSNFLLERFFAPIFTYSSMIGIRALMSHTYGPFLGALGRAHDEKKTILVFNRFPYDLDKVSQAMEETTRYIFYDLNNMLTALGARTIGHGEMEGYLKGLTISDSAIPLWADRIETAISRAFSQSGVSYESGSFKSKAIELLTVVPGRNDPAPQDLKERFGSLMAYFDHQILDRISGQLLDQLSSDELFSATGKAFLNKFPSLARQSFETHIIPSLTVLQEGGHSSHAVQTMTSSLDDLESAVGDPVLMKKAFISYARSADFLIEDISMSKDVLGKDFPFSPKLISFLEESGLDPKILKIPETERDFGGLQDKVQTILSGKPEENLRGIEFVNAQNVIESGLGMAFHNVILSRIDSMDKLSQKIFDVPVGEEDWRSFFKSLGKGVALHIANHEINKAGVSMHLSDQSAEDWIWNISDRPVRDFLMKAYLVHQGILLPAFWSVSGGHADRVSSLFEAVFRDVKTKGELEKALFLYARKMDELRMGLPGARGNAELLTHLMEHLDKTFTDENRKEWMGMASQALGAGAKALLGFPLDIVRTGTKILGDLFIKKGLGEYKDPAAMRQMQEMFILMQNEIQKTLKEAETPPSLIVLDHPDFLRTIANGVDSPGGFLKNLEAANKSLIGQIRLVAQDPLAGKRLEDSVSRHFSGARTYYDLTQRYSGYMEEIEDELKELSKRTNSFYDSGILLQSALKMRREATVIQNGPGAREKEFLTPLLSDIITGKKEPDVSPQPMARLMEVVHTKVALKYDLARLIAERAEGDFDGIGKTLERCVLKDVETLGVSVYGAFGEGGLPHFQKGLGSIEVHFIRALNLLKLQAAFRNPDDREIIEQGSQEDLLELKAVFNAISKEDLSAGASIQGIRAGLASFLSTLDQVWERSLTRAGERPVHGLFFTAFQDGFSHLSTNREVAVEDVQFALKEVGSAAKSSLENALRQSSLASPPVHSLGRKAMKDIYEKVLLPDEFYGDFQSLTAKISSALNFFSYKDHRIARSLAARFQELSHLNPESSSDHVSAELMRLSRETDEILSDIYRQNCLPYCRGNLPRIVSRAMGNGIQSMDHLIQGGFHAYLEYVKSELKELREKGSPENNMFSRFSLSLSDAMERSKDLRGFIREADGENIRFLELVQRMGGEDRQGSSLTALMKGSKNEAEAAIRLEDYARSLENVIKSVPGYPSSKPDEEGFVSLARRIYLENTGLGLGTLKSVYMALRERAQEKLLSSLRGRIEGLNLPIEADRFPLPSMNIHLKIRAEDSKFFLEGMRKMAGEIAAISDVYAGDGSPGKRILEISREELVLGKDGNVNEPALRFIEKASPIIARVIKEAGGNCDEADLTDLAEKFLPMAHQPAMAAVEMQAVVEKLKIIFKSPIRLSRENPETMFELLSEGVSTARSFIWAQESVSHHFISDLKELGLETSVLEEKLDSIRWEETTDGIARSSALQLETFSSYFRDILGKRGMEVSGRMESISKMFSETREGNLNQVKALYQQGASEIMDCLQKLRASQPAQGGMWDALNSLHQRGILEKCALLLCSAEDRESFKGGAVRSLGRLVSYAFYSSVASLAYVLYLSTPAGWVTALLMFISLYHSLMVFMAAHEWGPFKNSAVHGNPVSLDFLPPEKIHLLFSHPYICSAVCSSYSTLANSQKIEKIKEALASIPGHSRGFVLRQAKIRLKIDCWTREHPIWGFLTGLRFIPIREIGVSLGTVWQIVRGKTLINEYSKEGKMSK